MSYIPGQRIELYMDALPATITPLPAGVPANYKLRIVCTEEMVTCLWQTGNGVGRFDIDMTREQMSALSFRGGQAGDYTIMPAGGCGCGMGLLKAYQPFPDQTYVQTVRSSPKMSETLGVPPKRMPLRWSRISG